MEACSFHEMKNPSMTLKLEKEVSKCCAVLLGVTVVCLCVAEMSGNSSELKVK